MKPQELLDMVGITDDHGDPIAALDALLESIPSDVPQVEKLSFLERLAALLARAPLGSVDIYASSIRDKLGFTKGTLTNAVQTARAATSASSGSTTKEIFEPTPEDMLAAQAVLAAPAIEDAFIAAMTKLGVVGESLNLVLLLLTIVSRLLARPICVALKSASSTGKSFLMNMVVSTLPPNECIVFTAASAKALYYRTDSLSHKVLVFMERPGAEANDYQVRILQSEGKMIYSVAEKDPDTGQIVTNDRVIEGPVAYIETTTEATLHDENETRIFSASLDESAEATGKIIEEQARRAAGPVADEKSLLVLWCTVHTLLKPATVVIPFAGYIAKHFPRRVVRARRDFPRFLSLIEASAVLYQHQRARDDNGAIIASLDDYALARRLAIPLLESAMLGASEKTRKLIAVAREFASAESAADPTSAKITASKLSRKLPSSGWSRASVRRHLKAAEEAGYLDLVSAQRGQESVYGVAKAGEEICLALPLPQELIVDPPADGPRQPDQGASNANDALNSNDANGLVEVNQPRQGVQGDRPLFEPDPNPKFRHPDLV